MLLAIIFLVIGIAACFMISVPESTSENKIQSDDNSMSLLQAAKTWPFWLLFAGCFLYNGTWNMLSPVIKTLGITRGLSDAAAINPATSTDFFGPRYAGTNYGVIMLSLGLSSVVFNMISNALHSTSGSYTATFIIGAASAAASVIIYIVINRLRKKS